MLGIAAPLRRQGVKVINTRDWGRCRYDGGNRRLSLA
jgi:hypothetical protein